MESYGDSRGFSEVSPEEVPEPPPEKPRRRSFAEQFGYGAFGPKLYFIWPASVLGGHIYANDDCRDDLYAQLCTYLPSQHLSRAESRPAPHQLMPCERGVILKTQPPPQPRAQEAPKPRFSSGFIGIWVNFGHLPVWSVGWMRNCRPQFIHVGAIQSAGPRNFTLESNDPIQPDLLCG